MRWTRRFRNMGGLAGALVITCTASTAHAALTSPENRWLCSALTSRQTPDVAMKSFPLEPLKVTVGTGLGTFGTTVIGNGKTYGAAYAELVRPWGGDGEYGSMWQVAAGVPRSSPERPRAEAWMKALAAEWGPPIGERNGMIILREVRGRDGAYAVVMYKGATLQVFWTEGGAQLAQSFCR